jgi:hypothetical protein
VVLPVDRRTNHRPAQPLLTKDWENLNRKALAILRLASESFVILETLSSGAMRAPYRDTIQCAIMIATQAAASPRSNFQAATRCLPESFKKPRWFSFDIDVDMYSSYYYVLLNV